MNIQMTRDYLLGSTYVGPGLLRRVEERVIEQDVIDGPVYRTGSVMEMGTSAGKDHGSDEGLSERCFDLLVALTQWLGKGIGWDRSGRTSQKLLEALHNNRITDVILLTQGDRDDKGTLERVREEIDRLIPRSREGELAEDDPVRTRCEELIRFLQSWMEADCDHDWERVSSTDIRVSVFRCSCGVQRYQRDGEEEWLAV
jgi:hypothetical protein